MPFTLLATKLHILAPRPQLIIQLSASLTSVVAVLDNYLPNKAARFLTQLRLRSEISPQDQSGKYACGCTPAPASR
jgi:hypothetical protein